MLLPLHLNLHDSVPLPPIVLVHRRLQRMKRQLARIQAKDFPGVNDALEKIRTQVNALSEHPLLDGQLILNVDLENGVTRKINHALGRPWTNYEIGAIRGAATTGRIEWVIGGDTSKQLWLEANGFGATVRVSLYVY